MAGTRPFIKIKGPGIIIFLAVLLMTSSFLLLPSCSPRQVFGELLICSDIDSQTFEPVGVGDEYTIDSFQIVAAVRVSGVKGDDRWRFTWRNSDTGEVIADSTNNYSTNKPAYVEGYLSNKLLPAEGSGIIAEPGKYTVSYYHNGELKDTSDFTIKRPRAEILETGLYKDLDKDDSPGTPSSTFYQSDEIYTALKLDYKIEGDIFGIKWFRDEMLLGEEEYTISKSIYEPGYLIFQLVNEDQSVFPVGSYRVEIISYGEVLGEYFFDIVPEAYSDEIFAGKQIYRNEEFGFEVMYPDDWSLHEEEIEAGLKAGIAPDDGIRQIIINIWVLKKNYFPSPEDYSGFADGLLEEQKGQEEGENIEKTENSKTVGDLELFEVRYDNINEAGGGWSMTFSFIREDSLLFLFMRLTDPSYIDYGEKVVDHMIDSISFNE